MRPLLARPVFERLVSGLTLCLGIESLITLQDVRRLASEDAIEICRWAAHAMFKTAMRERNGAPARNRPPRRNPRKAAEHLTETKGGIRRRASYWPDCPAVD